MQIFFTFLVAGLLLLCTTPSFAQSAYNTTMNSGFIFKTAGMYNYAVHLPASNIPKPWPMLLSLPGSSTMTDSKDISKNIIRDGYGKVLGEYEAGKRGEVHTLAGERFLTVIPISRKTDPADGHDIRHWRPAELMKVFHAVKSDYKVDAKFFLSGYSMGSRGSWRFLTSYPLLVYGMHAAAGQAEKVNDAFMKQESAPPTFDRIDGRLANVPIWMFASGADTTDTSGDGTGRSLEVLGRLRNYGNMVTRRTVFQRNEGVVHDPGMATKPFTAEVLNWMLSLRR